MKQSYELAFFVSLWLQNNLTSVVINSGSVQEFSDVASDPGSV